MTNDSDDDGEVRGTGDTTAPFREKPDPETIEQIQQEREERLDPDNRPDNAEVDNTHRHFNEETHHFEDHDEELRRGEGRG